MKKKRDKKLVFSKETIRDLTTDPSRDLADLAGVVGGAASCAPRPTLGPSTDATALC